MFWWGSGCFFCFFVCQDMNGKYDMYMDPLFLKISHTKSSETRRKLHIFDAYFWEIFVNIYCRVMRAGSM
jgi:hypothetical protein